MYKNPSRTVVPKTIKNGRNHRIHLISINLNRLVANECVFVIHTAVAGSFVLTNYLFFSLKRTSQNYISPFKSSFIRHFEIEFVLFSSFPWSVHVYTMLTSMRFANSQINIYEYIHSSRMQCMWENPMNTRTTYVLLSFAWKCIHCIFVNTRQAIIANFCLTPLAFVYFIFCWDAACAQCIHTHYLVAQRQACCVSNSRTMNENSVCEIQLNRLSADKFPFIFPWWLCTYYALTLMWCGQCISHSLNKCNACTM